MLKMQQTRARFLRLYLDQKQQTALDTSGYTTFTYWPL